MVEKGTKIEFEDCLQKYFGDEMIADFRCGNCNKKTVCVKRQRFNSFPKVLVINHFYFVLENWVPKKLDIDVQIPQDKPLDLERFRGNQGQLQPGEIPIAAAAESDMAEPELNPELLNQIMQMGVPELGAKHALHQTGNNSADMAIAWFFENMDNPIINQPLLIKKASSSTGGGVQVP
jgi:ubiquitin carboxyl-terminal hydrolase 5/13